MTWCLAVCKATDEVTDFAHRSAAAGTLRDVMNCATNLGHGIGNGGGKANLRKQSEIRHFIANKRRVLGLKGKLQEKRAKRGHFVTQTEVGMRNPERLRAYATGQDVSFGQDRDLATGLLKQLDADSIADRKALTEARVTFTACKVQVSVAEHAINIQAEQANRSQARNQVRSHRRLVIVKKRRHGGRVCQITQREGISPTCAAHCTCRAR